MTCKPNIFKLTITKLWVFATLFILLILILELATNIFELNGLAIILLSFFFIVGFWGCLILAQDVHSISIDESNFVATNLITRKSFSLSLDEYKEFEIYIHFSRYRGVQFDLIFSDNENSYEPISLYYLDNVNDLVTELEKKLRNTTRDEYGILDLLKKHNQD